MAIFLTRSIQWPWEATSASALQRRWVHRLGNLAAQIEAWCGRPSFSKNPPSISHQGFGYRTCLFTR
jgi:hypothetical protein